MLRAYTHDIVVMVVVVVVVCACVCVLCLCVCVCVCVKGVRGVHNALKLLSDIMNDFPFSCVFQRVCHYDARYKDCPSDRLAARGHR